MKLFYSFLTPSLFIFLGTLSACSTVGRSLVGEVKPVDTQADKTIALDLSQLSPPWVKIEHATSSNSGSTTGSPDAAWQSSKTAAIISIDSACRDYFDDDIDLKIISQSLLSQWNELKVISEKNLTVSGHPALETTAQGYYLKRQRKLQTVNIKTSHCIYDLIYLSPLESFDQDLAVFHQFRDSLILK